MSNLNRKQPVKEGSIATESDTKVFGRDIVSLVPPLLETRSFIGEYFGAASSLRLPVHPPARLLCEARQRMPFGFLSNVCAGFRARSLGKAAPSRDLAIPASQEQVRMLTLSALLSRPFPPLARSVVVRLKMGRVASRRKCRRNEVDWG